MTDQCFSLPYKQRIHKTLGKIQTAINLLNTKYQVETMYHFLPAPFQELALLVIPYPVTNPHSSKVVAFGDTTQEPSPKTHHPLRAKTSHCATNRIAA
ncbi:MAG: hypothetical protein HY986_00265 [Candidatus Melainabacteria bacterium]|nr:hypothetical protein [Candidatus Melainabacteria bacterium]